ncbi:MAG: TonB-dependent receptor [Halioglobus sp.]
MKKTLIISTSLLATAMQSAPIAAQDDPSFMLEEVIVTARRKQESLQSVPLSITPFSGIQIEQRDIHSLEDLAAETVGMNYWSSPTSGYQSSPTIRGLSTGFLQDRVQNVAGFLNGIYLQRQSMMNVGMTDLQRIEVLKGPQNAMYGHSAFAGAINYVTEKPSDEFDGYLSTTQGSDERADYRAALNVPLVPEKLLARVSYGSSEFDGATNNDHAGADISSSGFHNVGNLGGWDDTTANAALTFRPTDTLQFIGEYYKTDLKRESQPYYIVSGLRDVAINQTTRFDDLNANEITLNDPNAGLVTGNTMWKGEFPDSSPGAGNCIFSTSQDSCVDSPDQRSTGTVVDPRAYGMTAETEIISLDVFWEASDSLIVHYLYGNSEHAGSTGGPAERDQLNGAELFDITKTDHSNISSARPITNLESDSHELRLDWESSDTLAISVGFFYADVEDEQYDFTVFAPVCSDRDLNGDGSNADEMAGCKVSIEQGVDNTPLENININPFFLFSRENWHGNFGNHTQYEDKVSAIFASVDWQFTDALALRAEGRYTEEKRSIERLSDGFGTAPGETACSPGVIPFCLDSTIIEVSDSETFDYFAPRVSLEWQLDTDSMAYASIASGIKAGGFNNAAAESQQTFDEEQNWTFELGSKNILLDGALKLNGALYYIDWTDIQGSQPPQNSSINSAAVTGNIGDATSMGIELESTWYVTQGLSLDLGYAYNNAEYDSGEYDTAQRYLYYGCEQAIVEADDLCGDTDIKGNSLPRNSEHQVVAGVNYEYAFDGGWTLTARLSSNYQSKQFITPLNEAYVPARTLVDGNIQLGSTEHWELALWGKNLLDEEYASGVINILEQNKYMVSQGAPLSWGARVRYNF